MMESPAQRLIDRNTLSRVLKEYRSGDRTGAETYMRETLKMVPGEERSRCCLAALALETRDFDAAGQLLNESSVEAPSVEALYLRGRLAEARGDMTQALSHLKQALGIKPDYVGALYAMGRVMHRNGDSAEAAVYYRKALRLHPGFTAAAHQLGKVLFSVGRLDDALAAFRQALIADPTFTVIHMAMASTLREIGDGEQARVVIQAALERDDDPLLRIQHSLMLPIIFSSDGDIDEVRARMEKELDGIAARHIRSTDPFAFPGNTGFYLAYHGQNNRRLQSRLAEAYRTAAPDLVWTAPQPVNHFGSNDRIRVAIVSHHLHRHTIGYLNAGIVKHLSRSAFEVTVGRFQDQAEDDMSAAIDRTADRVVHLAPEIPEARRQLADLNLDLIYYPDIGMHPVTYFLAYSRLAPVQCTSWGHPDTTGIANLDYYISNRLAEPVGAQAHYTEKLVCLSRFPMYLSKPSPAPVRRRQDFGLPADRRVYLCPQSLFKLHPDFDALVEGILRQDREGVLVLFHGKHSRWRELLLKRMARRTPDLVERVLFLPRVPEADFPSILRAADAVVDPPHFTGGYTSLIAFGQGVPVVTLPGAFMRGRLTYALYRQMGLAEMVAVDATVYVALALRLANDRDFYRQTSDRIRERAHLIYDDLTPVRELERFFVQAVEGTR